MMLSFFIWADPEIFFPLSSMSFGGLYVVCISSFFRAFIMEWQIFSNISCGVCRLRLVSSLLNIRLYMRHSLSVYIVPPPVVLLTIFTLFFMHSFRLMSSCIFLNLPIDMAGGSLLYRCSVLGVLLYFLACAIASSAAVT